MILKNLLILLHLLQGVYCFGRDNSEDEKEDTIFVDFKTNVTRPCHHETQVSTVWIFEGPEEGRVVMPDGSLFLPNVTRQMSGHYVCLREEDDKVITAFNLMVRGPPDAPQNVSIHASTVIAVVRWHLHIDDDSWEDSAVGPRTKLHLQYRRLPTEQWIQYPFHVSPDEGQVDVYNLQPNSTYEFQMWSSNKYGRSDIISINATTNNDDYEIELARMLEEDMKGFSPKVWIVAVIVVMVVINVSGLYLFVVNCWQHKLSKSDNDELEGIELVPNIIENPGYHNLETVHESLLTTSSVSHSRTALV